MRVGLGVTLLETKDSVLGEVRVGCNEAASAVLLADSVDGNVRSISVLVPNVCVSVREGTTLDVLTRESDVVALVDKRGESE